MRRRDISKTLFATAIGSAAVGRTAEAQTCSPPCYPQTAAEGAAHVTPVNCTYPPGTASRYGMIGDATPGVSGTGTDNTAAFNNLLAVCSQGTGGFIPAGYYRFASKPNVIGNTCTLRGEAKGWVTLIRDYNETTPTNGFIEANGGALELFDIYLCAQAGTSGGAGIHLYAQSGGASPDYSRLDGIVVSGYSGTGTWNYAIYADGSARTSPPGLRDLFINGSKFFAATSEIAIFATCNAANINAGFFPAGGTATSVRVSGVSGNLSNNVIIRAEFLETLNLDYCSYVTVITSTGLQNINNTTNVSESQVVAPYVFAAQNFWSNSQVIARNAPQTIDGLILTSPAPTALTSGQVSIGNGTLATVGSAGSAAALPSAPAGYLVINIAGVNYEIPYYLS